MNQRSGLLVASIFLLGSPLLLGPPPGRGPDDPLNEIVVALDQGRHWYAARLLRDLDPETRASPQTELLAARADAGRGAWRSVIRQLESREWLDSLSGGEGRGLLARAWLETEKFDLAVRDYTAFLAGPIGGTSRALAELGLARALALEGAPREAAAAYVRAAWLEPKLEGWAELPAAENLALVGDTAAVRALLEQSAEGSASRRLLARVASIENAGDVRRAVEVMLDAASRPETRSNAAELRTRAAVALLALGDTAAANLTLRQAIRVQPSRALEAARLLEAFPGLIDDDEMFLAEAFEKARAPLSAARHYSRYPSTKLPAEERLRLRLRIGVLLYRAGSYLAAVDELEALADENPPPSILARAEYYAARATYRRGWRREGRARLREVADRHPGTPSALLALSTLGDIYDGAGDSEAARAVYADIADHYAGSRAAPRARYRLGILAFLEEDYAGARRHFDRLRSSRRWTELKIRATYWAARARVAEGSPASQAEAERLFRIVHSRDPFGYYGMLAARRAAIDPWAQLSDGPVPIGPSAEITRRLALVDLLRRAGLRDEAREVLTAVLGARPSQPAELLGLARAVAELGYGREGVALGWQAHAKLRGIWSQSVLQAVYPLAFEQIIRAESDTRGVDPNLMAAIARQESAFSSDVISRAGARGLLQLMPQTGRWWAGRMGIRDYSHELLFHPETNLHLGTAYFADLQRRYDDLQLSLIAYNAGPTRARRWRERPEYQIDSELFVERIPFSETRDYVRNVQSHYAIYSHLYDAPRPSAPVD